MFWFNFLPLVNTNKKVAILGDDSEKILIMAGSAGFEPANAGTKTQCLTTWRRPISARLYQFYHVKPEKSTPDFQRFCYNYPHG